MHVYAHTQVCICTYTIQSVTAYTYTEIATQRRIAYMRVWAPVHHALEPLADVDPAAAPPPQVRLVLAREGVDPGPLPQPLVVGAVVPAAGFC